MTKWEFNTDDDSTVKKKKKKKNITKQLSCSDCPINWTITTKLQKEGCRGEFESKMQRDTVKGHDNNLIFFFLFFFYDNNLKAILKPVLAALVISIVPCNQLYFTCFTCGPIIVYVMFNVSK